MPPERIEHHTCPDDISERLRNAGGTNFYGEPNFRVVWGYDRIVSMTGMWHDTRQVETRLVPKYLPGNMWFLEMWRPPEEYGTPETWGKLGEEVVGMMTVDTAGPFPARGEYELCYPLSDNLTPQGKFVPLCATVVETLVRLIQIARKETLSFECRKAAILQREERERQQRIDETTDALLGARPAFYDQPTSFSSGPKCHKIESGLWIPN